MRRWLRRGRGGLGWIGSGRAHAGRGLHGGGLGQGQFGRVRLHHLRRLSETALGRLLASGALRGQFGLIVPVVRPGAGDGDLRPRGDLGKEAFRQRRRQADTPMRCGVSRSGDGTRMQSDTVIGKAEEIRHFGPRETPARRNLVPATLGITDHHLAFGIVDLAVKVRFLGLLLADDRELTRRGGKFLDPRGHVAPADLLRSVVKPGLLGIGVDPDVGDLALVTRPFPALAFGGGGFLGLHGQHGGWGDALDGGLNLSLSFFFTALRVREESLGKTGQMHAAKSTELQYQGRQGGQEGPEQPFPCPEEGTEKCCHGVFVATERGWIGEIMPPSPPHPPYLARSTPGRSPA